MNVDPVCSLNLGPQGLAAIAQALHLGVCLTCAQTMTGLPNLVIDAYPHHQGGYAGLHHTRCAPAQWRPTDQAPDYTATCSLSHFLLTNEQAAWAVMVLNPMLESVLVVPGDDGQWYPALHPQYTDAGLVPADERDMPPVAPGLHVTIDQATIYLHGPADNVMPDRPMPVPGDVVHAARSHGSVLVAVTQAQDPVHIDGDQMMIDTVYHPLTRVGLVTLRG